MEQKNVGGANRNSNIRTGSLEGLQRMLYSQLTSSMSRDDVKEKLKRIAESVAGSAGAGFLAHGIDMLASIQVPRFHAFQGLINEEVKHIRRDLRHLRQQELVKLYSNVSPLWYCEAVQSLCILSLIHI